MRLFFVLFCVSGLLSIPCLADASGPAACASFSLADPGGPMENIPVRDQGDVGTCYAYAAAGAIDAWRVTQDPSTRNFHTSPHAIAISAKALASPMALKDEVRDYAHDKIDTPVDSFDPPEAVLTAWKSGTVCDYNAFGAHKSSQRDLPCSSLTDLDPTQSCFWTKVTELYKFCNLMYTNAAGDKERQTEAEMARTKFHDLLCASGFDNTQSTFESDAAMIDVIAKKDVFGALKALSDKVCENHTQSLPKPIPSPVTYLIGAMPNAGLKAEAPRAFIMKNMIDAMLNFKRKQPIMINYCPGVLNDPAAAGIDPKTGLQANGGCGLHANLIIGRGTMPDGSCGYLLRNSWGTDRDWYHGVPSNIDGNGNVWVSEESLLRNLEQVSVIPPPGESYTPPPPSMMADAEKLIPPPAPTPVADPTPSASP